MANRTDTQADTVHGTNPQYLVDKIIRNKIYNDAYWKEFCFGLTTESLIDRAAEIDYVGGTYGGRRRPAKFLCLFLKMLQIQPDDDVVLEYIKQPDLKYLRALGAAYYRISQRHIDVHKTLEPLYADYRKLRYRDLSGKMSIIHMDEFIDWLFREKTVCDVTMPGMPKREILEATLDLPPRQSVLEDDLEDLDDLEEPPPAVAAAAAAAAAAEAAASAAASSSGGAAGGGAGPSERSESPAARKPSRSRSPKRRARSASSDSGEARERKEKKGKKEPEDRRDAKEKKEKKDKKDKKAKKEKAEKAEGGGKKDRGGDRDGLSVEQSNELRKKLGLKPLKV